MIAIVFAAGIGSRLRPFTDFHPKALAPLGGKPALIRVLDKLVDNGARRIIVNVHHFPQQIISCIAALPYAGMIEISDESSLLLDTGGALAKIARDSAAFASAEPGEPIVVHNADIYTDFPLTEMIVAHEKAHADATLLVDPHRSSTRHFLFDADKRLRGWENTAKGITRPALLTDATSLTSAAFGGVHVLNPDTIRRISDSAPEVIVPMSVIDWYIDNCVDNFIHSYTPSAPYRWHDIGTPEKLAAAQPCFD